MSFDVFISHASRDRPTAEAVHQILESNGITCWISSRNITGGQRWSEAVVSAINNTRITVLILSANSSHSRWVPKEIELSVRRGGAIIPLRIEDAKPTGALELYLSEVQHIDAFDGPLDAHMDKLLETVRSYLSDGDTPRISTSQPAIADSGPSPVESLSKAERLRDASSLGRQDRFSGKSAAHRGKAGTEPASVVTNQQYDFDICLCSSKQDQPQVTRLMEELLLEGLTICWEDEGELVQQDVNDVERDIRASKIVIVCVGEHFYESVWNRRPYLDLLLRERHVRKATFHVVKVTNRVETGFPIFVQDQFFSDIREDEQRAAFVKWQVSTVTAFDQDPAAISQEVPSERDPDSVNHQKALESRIVALSRSTNIKDDVLVQVDKVTSKLLRLLSGSGNCLAEFSQTIAGFFYAVDRLGALTDDAEFHRFLRLRRNQVETVVDELVPETDWCDQQYVRDIQDLWASGPSLRLNDTEFEVQEWIDWLTGGDELDESDAMGFFLNLGFERMAHILDQITDKNALDVVFAVLWKRSPRILLYHNRVFSDTMKYIFCRGDKRWQSLCQQRWGQVLFLEPIHGPGRSSREIPRNRCRITLEKACRPLPPW